MQPEQFVLQPYPLDLESGSGMTYSDLYVQTKIQVHIGLISSDFVGLIQTQCQVQEGLRVRFR